MSTNSKIEWTEATWNPVVGCTRVSAGCDHCYAVLQSYRNGEMGNAKYKGLTVINGKGDRHFNGVVRTIEEALEIPLRRRKPTKYFVNSMSDLFHKEVPFEFIDKVFSVINATRWTLPIDPDLSKPWHTYQILTKRPDRMAEYMLSRSSKNFEDGEHPIFAAGRKKGGALRGHGLEIMNAGACLQWPPPNAWLCASAENQEAYEERIGHLLRCPAAVRGLSLEPLLGPINLNAISRTTRAVADEITDEDDAFGPPLGGVEGIDWVIVGGESGPGARNCRIDWIESIVKQCKDADVPIFVKQLGKNPTFLDHGDTPLIPGQSWHEFRVGPPDYAQIYHPKGGNPDEWPAELRVRQFPKLQEVP